MRNVLMSQTYQGLRNFGSQACQASVHDTASEHDQVLLLYISVMNILGKFIEGKIKLQVCPLRNLM